MGSAPAGVAAAMPKKRHGAHAWQGEAMVAVIGQVLAKDYLQYHAAEGSATHTKLLTEWPEQWETNYNKTMQTPPNPNNESHGRAAHATIKACPTKRQYLRIVAPWQGKRPHNIIPSKPAQPNVNT